MPPSRQSPFQNILGFFPAVSAEEKKAKRCGDRGLLEKMIAGYEYDKQEEKPPESYSMRAQESMKFRSRSVKLKNLVSPEKNLVFLEKN